MTVSHFLIWELIARTFYFGLFVWILIWNTLINPPYPAALALLSLITPLLLTLRGILHSRRHSYIWLSILTPFYFALGASHAYINSETRVYGIGLFLLSLALFVSALGTIRANRRDQNQHMQ